MGRIWWSRRTTVDFVICGHAAGVMWFEKFYTPADKMALYVAVIDHIGYKKVFWNMTRKEDLAEWSGPHVYLNCLLEKPERLE